MDDTMTEQPLTKMPPGEWETHSLDTGEDHAAARFAKKHGYPPTKVLDVFFSFSWPSESRVWGFLICGPVNGKEAQDA